MAYNKPTFHFLQPQITFVHILLSYEVAASLLEVGGVECGFRASATER